MVLPVSATPRGALYFCRGRTIFLKVALKKPFGTPAEVGRR